MKISSFQDLADAAKLAANKAVVAVVEAQDEHTLESVVEAARDGIMRPILIGDFKEISGLLSRFGAKADDYEIHPSKDADESLAIAIQLIRDGKATAIMKGMIDTGRFMQAILNKKSGLVSGGLLSLIGFYETPKYHKLFAVSDFGLNTYPNLEAKRAILVNAVGLLHKLGIEQPKVAVLSAVEKPNPKMPDAVDGVALKDMNKNGLISGCIVEGPIAFDLATSAEAARIKGYDSPVAGDADLLIVPDIVSGNMLVKCLTGFGGARTAGTVLGARVPIILTSRSAETSDKYYSITLAACAASGYRGTGL
jgi:phosphotransacetylase